MMGSCKKILRSLSDTDLNNEWLLRLLKAFSMYSVNNPSYISEANEELELGFYNLYKDENFHEKNFEIIRNIIDTYFEKLKMNILRNEADREKHPFIDIETIHLNLLLKMQAIGIEYLMNRNNQLNGELYA
jgi:ATP-dependent DNA helicase RecQ